MALKEKIKKIFVDDKTTDKRINSDTTPIIHIISTVQESEKIAVELLQLKSVIVNLNNITLKEKYRVIDFLSGVVFALQGRRVKLEKNIYLFNPTS